MTISTDATLGRTPLTPEQSKALAVAKLKSRAIGGAVAGGGIAIGSAATDIALAGAAEAAGVVATAAAESVIVPTVITIAAVGGICYGTYRFVKWLSN